MITTRRSENSNEVFNSNVSVLEREPKTYREETQSAQNNIDLELERARRHENLNKLLNFNRADAPVAEPQTTTETRVEESLEIANSAVCSTDVQSDDMRPTSTTMQFGDTDSNEIFNELATNEGAKARYKLNSKGKLLIVLYSLAVAVIMALIVLNTGIISTLKTTTQDKQEELSARMTQYQELQAEANDISSNEYVIDVATNEYKMIKN